MRSGCRWGQDSFWGDEDVLKFNYGGFFKNNIESCILKTRTLWYGNDTSVELSNKKKNYN